jgi:hypothetical protein
MAQHNRAALANHLLLWPQNCITDNLFKKYWKMQNLRMKLQTPLTFMKLFESLLTLSYHGFI